MNRLLLLALAASALAGCAKPLPRLACTIQEEGASGRRFEISADLAPANGEGVEDLAGTIAYREGDSAVQLPVHGDYFDRGGSRGFELLTLADRPNRLGKLNIAVQPEHPVFLERGTRAMVLTGTQTVRDGTLAVANCHAARPS